MLLQPSGEASVGAITEPGAYRLVLRRYGARVLLVLVTYPDEVFYLKAPPVGGRVSAIATGPFEALLLSAARAFLIERDRLGENGYKRLWGYEFPSKPLRSLCEAAVLEGWSAA